MNIFEKLKEFISDGVERDVKQEETDTVCMLAKELANGYAEIVETGISEESDDAVREIIYRMYRRREYAEALNILMIIFELADLAYLAELIRDMPPEVMEEYGYAILKRFVSITGMDPDPTMEFDREEILSALEEAERRKES